MHLQARFLAHIQSVLADMQADGDLPTGLDLSNITVEPPRDPSHGDLATNAAMVLTKQAKLPPRDIATRLAQREIQSGTLGETERAATGWDTAWITYSSLSKEKPLAETIDFPEFRQEMVDGWRPKKEVYWAPGGARPKGVYRLPERFSSLF